ncbi:trna ligase [Coemansia sp. RSA 2322]|nr:trna ligase [Coemansia sp. RSA 2322]
MSEITRSPSHSLSGLLTQKESHEIRKLVATMKQMSETKPASKRIVRTTMHEYEGHNIASWKCTEFLYKKDPCPLPTQARGLFTSGPRSNETIVARGYNKFFNVGEVASTSWPSIEKNTAGPYELTVKENGCLILAAGLDDGKTLLVTSKHSIGVVHAQVGTEWVKRHLGQAGRTLEEFAAFLFENSATAVFELCDDEFEEHILEYTGRSRGLYLHGINRNCAELDTWPSAEVTRVAQEFGFHATKYFTFDSASEGREFADKVRTDHALDGRAIEGFVVRCRTSGGSRPFMFKIKYDEPYLMFREWREATKRILGGSPYRMTYGLTKFYVAWVKQQLKENPREFELYSKQKGIIAARKLFLEHYTQHGGSEAEVYEQLSGQKKTLLVPVATIGCGKTTIAVALSELFGFGHVQNDDIGKKSPRNQFHSQILKQFDDHDFVIADRNNHLSKLRQMLTTSIREELPNCRMVALYWSHEGLSPDKILKKTTARVVQRGEAHQTLTPQRTHKFRSIMNGFVSTLVPVDVEAKDDSLFDDVIELDPMEESAGNLRAVVDALCGMFPEQLKQPSDAEIVKALQSGLDYKPAAAKPEKGKPATGKSTGRKDARMPAYIGFVPIELVLNDWLEEVVGALPEASRSACRSLMGTDNCHNGSSHITVAHIAKRKHPHMLAICDGYQEIVDSLPAQEKLVAECVADYVVCNESIMALRVKTISIKGAQNIPSAVIQQPIASTPSSASPAVAADGKVLLASVNSIPHITLAHTANAKAAQSNDLLQRVFGPNNEDCPLECPSGWTVTPVTLSFKAKLQPFY